MIFFGCYILQNNLYIDLINGHILVTRSLKTLSFLITVTLLRKLI